MSREYWSAGVDIDVLFDNNLSLTARFIFTLLCAFAKINNRGVWPSNKTLAEKAGVSVSTVIRACKELKAKGAIKRSDRFDRNKGQISSYTLLVGHNAECYNGTDDTTPRSTHDTRRILREEYKRFSNEGSRTPQFY